MSQGGGAPAASSAMTPLVLTYNEAPNIARCLDRLAWASRVVVLDSGSTDDTAAICRRYPNVEVFTRGFDDHTSQWNYGVGLVTTPWVVALDADYVLSDALVGELSTIELPEDVDAAFASFRYCVFGRPLRASLYPPRAILFRRDRCRYEADGHTQRLVIPGRHVSLSGAVDHDDRKPFDRWFRSQRAYARLEADKLLAASGSSLGLQDRIRRTVLFGPIAVCVYTLFVRGLVFSGWRGWYYALQRTIAELVLSQQLLVRRFRH